MSSAEADTPRQHTSSAQVGLQLPEPTHGERCRTLLSLASIGTLSTHSHKHEGFPFGSLMPYALDSTGRPLFLISSMAMHTQNLKANPRASLFVGEIQADGDPLGAARTTLIGKAEPVPVQDVPSAREHYLGRHENGRYWVDFADFRFFRLEPADLYYVGGFGVMGWVSAADYSSATPDPLSQSAEDIISHMNEDHVDSMILLARTHSGLTASKAAMTAIDRLGFSLRLQTAEGMKGTRINFPEEATTSQKVRRMLTDMVLQAKHQL